jgi:hypothetical protein
MSASLSSSSEQTLSKREVSRHLPAAFVAHSTVLNATQACHDVATRMTRLTPYGNTLDTLRTLHADLAQVYASVLAAMITPAWQYYIHGYDGLKPYKRLVGKLLFMPNKLDMDVRRAGDDVMDLYDAVTKSVHVRFLSNLCKFAMNVDRSMRRHEADFVSGGGASGSLSAPPAFFGDFVAAPRALDHLLETLHAEVTGRRRQGGGGGGGDGAPPAGDGTGRTSPAATNANDAPRASARRPPSPGDADMSAMLRMLLEGSRGRR